MTKTPEELAEEAVEKTGYRLKRSVVDGTIMLRQGMDRQLKRQAFLNGFLAGYRVAKNQFADAGKVVTPQPNNYHWWRNIYKEYPDASGEFLVLVEYPDGAKEFDISKYEKDMYFALRYVTHWMPLPEPPEEEK